MKKIFVIVILILTSYLGAQEVIDLTKESPGTSPPSSPVAKAPQEQVINIKVRTYQDIEFLWKEFIDLVERNEKDASINILFKINEIRKELEIEYLSGYSKALTNIGYEQIKKRFYDYAFQIFFYAKEFDSANKEAYVGIAYSLIKKDVLSFGKALYFIFLGLRGRLSNLFSTIQFLIDSLNIFFLMNFLMIVVLSIILFLKYRLLFIHDLKENFSGKFSEKSIELIAYGVLILPFIFFIGWAWAFILWLMLFSKFGSKFEKFIVIMLILIAMLWVPFNKFSEEVLKICIKPIYRLYHRALFEPIYPGTLKSLENYVLQNPGDKRTMLVLANLWKRNGQLDKAISLYNNIIKLEPNAIALNNLANTYYQLDVPDNAIQYYIQALNYAPEDATIYYNYSLAVRAKFNFGKAEELMRKAIELDQNLILNYERRATNKKGVVDFIMTPKELFSLIYKETPFYNNPMKIILLFLNSSTIIILCLWIFLWMQKRKLFLARKCASCGIAYCKKCQAIEKKFNYCSQCLHLFIKKDGISQASKIEKLNFIEKEKKKNYAFSYLMTIFVPGSGSLYIGSIKLGILSIVIWAFLISLILKNNWTIEPYIVSEFNHWVSLLIFIIFVAYYLLFNLWYLLKPRKVKSGI